MCLNLPTPYKIETITCKTAIKQHILHVMVTVCFLIFVERNSGQYRMKDFQRGSEIIYYNTKTIFKNLSHLISLNNLFYIANYY